MLAQVLQVAPGKAAEEALDQLREVAAGDVVAELPEVNLESRHARGKVVVTV